MRIETFKNKNTVAVAKELLGKIFVHTYDGKTLKGIVAECEAYTEEDESCHAYRGKKTNANKAMFLDTGHLYVYFIYGKYYCMNIVTEGKNRGCAVLIRTLIPIEGIDEMIKNRGRTIDISNGPGKCCEAFGIDKKHNALNLFDKNATIYLEDIGRKPTEIITTKRIGISKAKEKKWRFIAKF